MQEQPEATRVGMPEPRARAALPARRWLDLGLVWRPRPGFHEDAARRLAVQHPAVHRAAGAARPGIGQQPGRPHRDGPDPAERYELSRRAARPGCTPTCRTPQTRSILTIPRCFSSALRGRTTPAIPAASSTPRNSSYAALVVHEGKDPYSDAGWMSNHPNNTRCGGVIYQHSACRMAEYHGRHEQHVPLRREDDRSRLLRHGAGWRRRSGLVLGWDYDVNRYTYYPANAPRSARRRRRATRRATSTFWFLAAHINGFAMAMCAVWRTP